MKLKYDDLRDSLKDVQTIPNTVRGGEAFHSLLKVFEDASVTELLLKEAYEHIVDTSYSCENSNTAEEFILCDNCGGDDKEAIGVDHEDDCLVKEAEMWLDNYRRK